MKTCIMNPDTCEPNMHLDDGAKVFYQCATCDAPTTWDFRSRYDQYHGYSGYDESNDDQEGANETED